MSDNARRVVASINKTCKQKLTDTELQDYMFGPGICDKCRTYPSTVVMVSIKVRLCANCRDDYSAVIFRRWENR